MRKGAEGRSDDDSGRVSVRVIVVRRECLRRTSRMSEWMGERRTGSVWEGKSERINEMVKLVKEGVGEGNFVGDCKGSTWRLRFQEAMGWLLSQIGCVPQRAWQGWLVNSKAITVHHLSVMTSKSSSATVTV